jgi:hypothetical protein
MWFWVPFAILLRSWLIFQPSSENMKGQHVDDVVIMSSNWVERRRQSRGQQSGWPYSAAFADLFVKKKIMKAGASSENMKGQHVDDFFLLTYVNSGQSIWPVIRSLDRINDRIDFLNYGIHTVYGSRRNLEIVWSVCARACLEWNFLVFVGPNCPLNHNPRERRSYIPSLRGEKDFYGQRNPNYHW